MRLEDGRDFILPGEWLAVVRRGSGCGIFLGTGARAAEFIIMGGEWCQPTQPS